MYCIGLFVFSAFVNVSRRKNVQIQSVRQPREREREVPGWTIVQNRKREGERTKQKNFFFTVYDPNKVIVHPTCVKIVWGFQNSLHQPT